MVAKEIGAAMITTGQRRMVTTMKSLVSDNTGIPAGDGKCPVPIHYHPIHSFLTY
jgi:hypothetical protein